MAKIRKQVKTVDKWKKKKWFTLIAPKTFQERPLGQTCSSDPDLLKGRTISVNLMSLTGNMKKQNMNVKFEVFESQGEKALTHVKKIDLVPAFLKRKVRRRRDRIDASFICKTKDEKHIRIKPMLITLSKSSRSVQTELKKRLLAYMIKTINETNYDDLMNDIVNYKFQRNIKQNLRKTFPVLDAEIRSTSLIDADDRKLKRAKLIVAPEIVEEEADEELPEEEETKEEAPAEAS